MSGLWRFDPHLDLQQITIVGLGGTGSGVARVVSRILYDLNQRNRRVPKLVLVDPDRIEMKNVGRQAGFSPYEAERGLFKAETLARRFSLSLGLEIHWYNEAFDAERHLRGHTSHNLVIGCVDNHEARQALAATRGVLWLDAGNGKSSGQICIGCSDDLDECLAQFDEKPGRDRVVSRMPNAACLFPELLLPEPVQQQPVPGAEDAELSCADYVILGEQGIVTNDLMSACAGQLVFQITNRIPLTTCLIYIDCDTLNVRGLPVARETIQQVLQRS